MGHVGREITVASGDELGENIVDGKVQEASIWATNVWVKEHGQPATMGHHAELLPFSEK